MTCTWDQPADIAFGEALVARATATAARASDDYNGGSVKSTTRLLRNVRGLVAHAVGASWVDFAERNKAMSRASIAAADIAQQVGDDPEAERALFYAHVAVAT